ncbi:phenylalanine ammonia-lyase, partial [Calocera cornea HHB12733]
GQPVLIDGHTLHIADIVASARYAVPVELDRAAKGQVYASDAAIRGLLERGGSVYGVSTGYGGSADTRTHQHLLLGKSCLQHQHCGVLPSDGTLSCPPAPPLPLSDPLATLSMPESWVRAAIAIRTNSLIRGHSGVQWSTVQAMARLLNSGITPLVPLRGSISASGDLQPLSYVAGALVGNPGIRCYSGPAGRREIVPAPQALAAAGLEPHQFSAKDHLGILNGTAFSAAVASLALYEAGTLALLAQVCTAMGTEALLGAQASHHPFIGSTRPHPGQVEAARNTWSLLDGSRLAVCGEEEERGLDEDRGTLRQDRYALRTSAQWLGPGVEDLLRAWATVQLECNSTTDNPLVDPQTGTVHHGGNFQALSLASSMEHVRLSLAHIGKLLFAQSTELLNPATNRGLAPSLASTDPALNYACKGLDIACAAYCAELQWLAAPVSTHVQSAEMHNQAVNSLALVSGRKTLEALELLALLVASYLYVLCQALDLRAQRAMFADTLRALVGQALSEHFAELGRGGVAEKLFATAMAALDSSSTLDAPERMERLAEACTAPLVNHLLAHGLLENVQQIPAFRIALSQRCLHAYTALRAQFLSPSGAHESRAPASAYLAPKTRRMYEYVRLALGVGHHGRENWTEWADGYDEEGTIGQGVSRIVEALRDGRMHAVVAEIFRM